MARVRRMAPIVAAVLLIAGMASVGGTVLASQSGALASPQTEPWALVVAVFTVLQGGVGAVLLWAVRRLIREEMDARMALHDADLHPHRGAVAKAQEQRDAMIGRLEAKLDRVVELVQAHRDERIKAVGEVHDLLTELVAEHRAHVPFVVGGATRQTSTTRLSGDSGAGGSR